MDAMLRSMTARQLLEWSVFAEVEPFGEDREDTRFASVVQVLANANRPARRKHRPYTLEECMVPGGDVHQRRPRRQSAQEMKQIAQMWAIASES